jgi:hypothetical protein
MEMVRSPSRQAGSVLSAHHSPRMELCAYFCHINCCLREQFESTEMVRSRRQAGIVLSAHDSPRIKI